MDIECEMEEEWVIYKDDVIPNDKYDSTSIIQNCNGTEITLEGEQWSLQIHFWGIDSLRVTDEGKRIRTYNEIDSLQKYREDFVGTPMFTVKNSEFLAWVKKESAGFYGDLEHYAIVTMEDIIDIVSVFPPEITVKSIWEPK